MKYVHTHTEQLRALDDLVHQGKIRYVGVCNFQAWQVCRALWLQERLHASPLITVQNPYSLLNRSLETEMFPMVRELGLGVMAYAPLATGLLSGAYQADIPPPEGSLWATRRRDQFAEALAGRAADVLEVVRAVAAKHGVDIPQVALAWIMAQPEITVAISGADTIGQLEQNLGVLDVELDAEDVRRLNNVFRRTDHDARRAAARSSGPTST